jgi:hypothetical protein
VNGRNRPAGFAELVQLQELAELGERELFYRARERTGERSAALEREEASEERASRQLDAVFAQPSLCLDRLALAASDLLTCDERLAGARSALSEALVREDAARADCLEAGKRLSFIEKRACEERKKRLGAREEARLREAIGLHAAKAIVR